MAGCRDSVATSTASCRNRLVYEACLRPVLVRKRASHCSTILLINLSPLGDAVLVSDAAETAADDRNLVVLRDPYELPPILAGHQTPQLRAVGRGPDWGG